VDEPAVEDAIERVRESRGIGLFEATNLVLLDVLEPLVAGRGVADEAVRVAAAHWRDHSNTADELVEAKVAVWKRIKHLSGDSTGMAIPGAEGHLLRAVLWVLEPGPEEERSDYDPEFPPSPFSPDEPNEERGYCRDAVGFVAEMLRRAGPGRKKTKNLPAHKN
jgi:hypothetical protein